MTQAPPDPWYAIWTRSRHEQVVRDQLERKGYAAFLPTIPRWSRWKDRRKKVDWPLFPGYCFARFDPRERLPILKCTGVVSIVSFDGEIAPIPDLEIDGIRRLVESDLQFDPCPLIREGMMVEVVHGPLQGVVGRLVRKGSHARLMLAVDLIGQAVSVEVDAADVRAY
ncbi:MAG: UpxY family transcription antiterminator [Acidobacteriota bacterium]|nr:UpxY family transcription antiterminator [Acidobacteriota bacterium]